MALVDAYDRKTGNKLPYLVPESHFDHPFFGKRIAPLPSSHRRHAPLRAPEPVAETPVVTPDAEEPTETPDVGDN